MRGVHSAWLDEVRSDRGVGPRVSEVNLQAVLLQLQISQDLRPQQTQHVARSVSETAGLKVPQLSPAINTKLKAPKAP